MKRTLTGGFISLVGSLWAMALIGYAGNTFVNGWSTPPGRFITSLSDTDVMPFFVLAVCLTVLGLIVMAVEYFKRTDRNNSKASDNAA